MSSQDRVANLAMDVPLSCRCCLRCPPGKDLETPYTHLGKTEIYADMLKECFDINLVLEGLGSYGICLACVGRLRDASDFKLQVQRSQVELLEALAKVMSSQDRVANLAMYVPLSCRCCLRCPPGKDLETPYTHLGKTEIYTDMLKDCFDINLVLEGLGSYGICLACIGRLRDASDFKLQVQRSQVELLEALAKDSEKELNLDLEIFSEDDTVKNEEPEFEPELGDDSNSNELHAELFDKPEIASEDETVSTDGMDPAQKIPDYAREQLSMICSVRLERLPDNPQQTTIHTRENTYTCEECGKVFQRKSILRKHVQIHHLPYKTLIDQIREKITCEFCSADFQTKFCLLEHERSEHGVTKYMCSECKYTTALQEKFERHLNRHIVNNDLKCSHCNFSTIYKHSFDAHQLIHTGKKPFQCSICDYKCSAKQRLQMHQKIHTDEKPLQCNDCAFKTYNLYNFQRHQKIHSAVKPFQCNVCDRAFHRKDKLQIHLMKHTGKRPFQCNDCGLKFIRKDHLKRHRKFHELA